MFFLTGRAGAGDAAAAAAAVRAMARAAGCPAAAGDELCIEVPGFVLAAGGQVTRAAGDGVHVVIGGASVARPGPDADAIAARCLGTYLEHQRLDLSALGGAYLLVLFDERQSSCVLVADRFATVPLFYTASDAGLSFSTRLAGLRAVPGLDWRVAPQALYDYVFFHCIPSPRTVIPDVSKLQPAERLQYRDGTVHRDTHWIPVFDVVPDDRDALAAELRRALEAAVREAQIGAATGAFLSGGLDSSTVAGLLQRVAPQPARTFTIGFGHVEYDETSYARIAARHFGTQHTEYVVTPADVTGSLEEIAAHYDEPFGNSSAVPTYYCARLARAAGIEVLLAGDGGDELFAGNVRYATQFVFERYLRIPAVLRAVLEQAYDRIPGLRALPLAAKGYRYIEQARMGLPDRLQSYNFLHRFDIRAVFTPEFLAAVDPEAPWQAWRARYHEPAAAGTLNRMLYLDWKFTLADNDLVKVSEMCALAGVEVRYPMLAPAVVDLSLRVAESLKLAGGNLRAFYKEALRDFLPPEVIGKSKHGFGLPFGAWMREHEALRARVHAALDALKKRGTIRADFIDHAITMHQSSAPGYYGELIWILMMLELWTQAHGF